MDDRQAYTLYVRGKVSGTCTFRAGDLTFRLPSNYGPTTSGTATVYQFVRVGSDVLVTWVPGY